jgi:hypothetical protein
VEALVELELELEAVNVDIQIQIQRIVSITHCQAAASNLFKHGYNTSRVGHANPQLANSPHT